MSAMVAMAMADDNLPRVLEDISANANLACGEGDFEQRAYRSFCESMNTLEDLLRHKGLLPKAVPGDDGAE